MTVKNYDNKRPSTERFYNFLRNRIFDNLKPVSALANLPQVLRITKPNKNFFVYNRIIDRDATNRPFGAEHR